MKRLKHEASDFMDHEIVDKISIETVRHVDQGIKNSPIDLMDDFCHGNTSLKDQH